MKVIEVISDTNVGGAGRLLLTRLSASNDRDIDTTLLLPSGSALESRAREIGIKVSTFRGCRDRSFDIGAVGKLCEMIREIEPDLINCHGCMSARIAAAMCRVPVRIYTRHCAYPVPLYMRLFPIKQIVSAVDRILSVGAIAVADAAKKNLTDMGISEDRIKVIINGVDGLRKYSSREREAAREELGVHGCFVVGICARLEKCKGHEDFLRAARMLARDDESYRFIIVGDGSLLCELRELASALGISDKVIFTGFTDDVEKYFNCFDINVNCSVGTETSSLALSEGMSIGLPSVASSYGGNPYMVRHGENGLIYTAGDFAALAQMIRRVAEDRRAYERMSEKAYERFSTELNSRNMTEQTEAFYLELHREAMRKGRSNNAKATRRHHPSR